jgi:hypothetical protein
VATIRQEWRAPVPASRVTLRVESVPSTGNEFLDMLSPGFVVLSVSDDTTGVTTRELARLDGRYLSQEVAASFTGRVIGLYAVDGQLDFTDFRYNGVES